MARKIATNKTVKRNELVDFIRPRHRGVLSTTRLNGRPQMSLVTMGLDDHDRVVIATYPERVKSIIACHGGRIQQRVGTSGWLY